MLPPVACYGEEGVPVVELEGLLQVVDLARQVDGGGVQAEVVESDVGASNGVIHSINRVKP